MTMDAGTLAHVTQLDIAALIGMLPIRQRIAMVERYWIGASTDETALLLGTHPDSVKHLRQRALARLARMLGAA